MTTRVPALVEDVPQFVIDSVPAFTGSQEFENLDPDLRSVPGLVVGQLTLLLVRLQTEAIRGPHSSQDIRETLQDIYATVEALASSPNANVQNIVIVEVLEHLHLDPNALQALLTAFGPHTRSLYTEWVSPGPDLKP
jgi:hypothetical protein